MVRSHITLPVTAVLLAALAGCGSSGTSSKDKPASGGTVKPTAAKVTHLPNGAAVATPGDVEAADSAPLPSGVRATKSAPLPTAVHVPTTKSAAASSSSSISPGAPSDAEIAAELKQMDAAVKQAKKAAANGRPTAPLALTKKGNAETPDNAPQAVAAIIAGANAIARFPYVYGGGHGSFVDTAYDCSGSVSYALATAGLLKAPLTSGELAKWGAPGPGKWVTIYANAGHTFMFIAGTRYDTSGRYGIYASRWSNTIRNVGGFTVRHPPGL